MIEGILNKSAAVELFDKEAILLCDHDVVPFYRAVELFGEEAAIFLDDNKDLNGYLKGGRDWNGMGACTEERPFIEYLYKAGFLKLVTEHNYLRVVQAHRESEGGHIIDRYAEERDRLLDARDEEDRRKAAERKARRAAKKREKSGSGVETGEASP